MKAVYFLLAASTCSFAVHAQFTNPKYEIGIGIGTLVYQGDLSYHPMGAFKELKTAFSLYGRRMLTNYFSVRLNLSKGQLADDEALYNYPAYKQIRNLRFTNKVTSVAALLQFTPLGERGHFGYRKLNGYIFGGVELNFLRVNRDDSRVDTTVIATTSKEGLGLEADAATTPPKLLLSIPIGLGVRYALNNKLSLFAETNYRYTFSDYLDGFSKVANPNKKDRFYGLTIGAAWKLVKNRFACPTIR
jgi:hypothetical protein